MARLANTTNSFLDSVLPTFGQERTAGTPVWNESQHMFITDQYVSAAGNTYYLGVRMSNRFVIILHIGLYHNWTYINEVEIYAFNGKQKELIGKTKIDQYYNEDLVRGAVEEMLGNYLESQMRMAGLTVNTNILDSQVKELVDASYCSMLKGNDLLGRLEDIKPLLLPSE